MEMTMWQQHNHKIIQQKYIENQKKKIYNNWKLVRKVKCESTGFGLEDLCLKK